MRIDHNVWRLKTRAIAIVFYGALLLIVAWVSKDLLTGYKALAHQDLLTHYPNQNIKKWFNSGVVTKRQLQRLLKIEEAASVAPVHINR